MKRKIDLNRITPPGRDPNQTLTIANGLFLLQAFLSFGIGVDYLQARSRLYDAPDYIGRLTEPQGTIAPFSQLADGYFSVVPPLLWIAMLTQVVVNYLYFRQGAMSVYLMRRLPDPWEYHRRCWSLPLLCGLGASIGCGAIWLFYFLIYLVCTPAGCLPY